MEMIAVHRDRFIPIIGIGAAVTATVSYIIWGGKGSSAGRDLRKHRKVAGLENLGNTCYLNTILQSLAACPKFVKWLRRVLRIGRVKGKRKDLAYKLSKTLEVVNDYTSSFAGSKTYSPHDVLYALHNCSWTPGREQQDCQELFQFLVTELQADSEELSTVPALSEAASLLATHRNGLVHQASLRSCIDVYLPPISTRGLELPFRGLIGHHLTCTACNYKTRVTYSQFDCLSLDIPIASFGMTSLEHMLNTFTRSELVQDVECSQCSKELAATEIASPSSPPTTNGCSSPDGLPESPVCTRAFRKQMTIAKLPQCLCIHVQRVVWTPSGAPMRKKEHVMFPEKLNMTAFHHIAGVSSSSASSSGSQQSLLNRWSSSSNSRTSGSAVAVNNNFIGQSFLQHSFPLPVIGGSSKSISRPNLSISGSRSSDGSSNDNPEVSCSNHSYHLMSAVVHMGDATSGHFLTYRRAPTLTDGTMSKKWLCISDDRVTMAALTDVLSQKAYMLYYQRI